VLEKVLKSNNKTHLIIVNWSLCISLTLIFGEKVIIRLIFLLKSNNKTHLIMSVTMTHQSGWSE